jgi:hypothetical protein
MNGPLLPGEVRHGRQAETMASLCRQLGTLECQWRAVAGEVICRLPAQDDLRLSLIRTLDALDQC